jgi:hypothetical protein
VRQGGAILAELGRIVNQLSPEVEHGIEDALYSNLPGPEQTACLYCLCGFRAAGRTWEDAGSDLDAHLAEVAANG